MKSNRGKKMVLFGLIICFLTYFFHTFIFMYNGGIADVLFDACQAAIIRYVYFDTYIADAYRIILGVLYILSLLCIGFGFIISKKENTNKSVSLCTVIFWVALVIIFIQIVFFGLDSSGYFIYYFFEKNENLQPIYYFTREILHPHGYGHFLLQAILIIPFLIRVKLINVNKTKYIFAILLIIAVITNVTLAFLQFDSEYSNIIDTICWLLCTLEFFIENKTAYSNSYIVDFVKNLIRKNNTGIIVWLFLNTALMTFVLGKVIQNSNYVMYDAPVIIPYLLGFLIYIITVIIALSPIGEFILRLQQGCKEVKRQDYLDRLNPLFNEVYQKAKTLNPELPDDIKFYMSKEEEPNAFATGRKTVCITKGLLKYSDEEIKAVLAHEFGHLAHKDTDAILVVAVGNIIVSAIFVVFRIIVKLFTLLAQITISIVSDDFAEVFVSGVIRVLIDFILVTIMNLWTRIGVLLCLHSSRSIEFQADEYACKLGYGNSLCKVLDSMDKHWRYEPDSPKSLKKWHICTFFSLPYASMLA